MAGSPKDAPALIAIGAIDDPHILEVVGRADCGVAHVSLQDMIRRGWAIAETGLGRPALSIGGEVLDCSRQTVLWLRKLSPFTLIEDFSGWEQAWAAEEWRAACDAIYTCFAHGQWLDHPGIVRQSEDKVRQLTAAAQAGFNVPSWSVGNSSQSLPAAASLVIKRLGTQRVPVPRGNHPVTAPFKEEFCNLAEFRLGVNFIQQRIVGPLEVRLVVFGTEVNAFSHERGDILDVHDSPDLQSWQRHEVDATVAAHALDLKAALGLSHCTIDLLVDADGVTWFLELNPRGNYLWLADATSTDLTVSLLALLSSGATHH